MNESKKKKKNFFKKLVKILKVENSQKFITIFNIINMTPSFFVFSMDDSKKLVTVWAK